MQNFKSLFSIEITTQVLDHQTFSEFCLKKKCKLLRQSRLRCTKTAIKMESVCYQSAISLRFNDVRLSIICL